MKKEEVKEFEKWINVKNIIVCIILVSILTSFAFIGEFNKECLMLIVALYSLLTIIVGLFRDDMEMVLIAIVLMVSVVVLETVLFHEEEQMEKKNAMDSLMSNYTCHQIQLMMREEMLPTEYKEKLEWEHISPGSVIDSLPQTYFDKCVIQEE